MARWEGTESVWKKQNTPLGWARLKMGR